ncbi:PaaX family transcriptional regulator [Actinomadura fibrosa]|uniref:PaaX family transcriptional regulator C-terminal domain-containing protein n=1 Tax=Actinomadura fibrosa TaxID=111802 RepID=A0ABW2XSE8_9ACTN|nr:PaaX family transcriptional regulator C-terminal domain-containing protein [Actinomadura fibrosa]
MLQDPSSPDIDPGAEADGGGAPRPQALLLTFFGSYVLGRHVRVATASVLDVLGRVGVSEDATRSTLSRMARGGLLDRARRGRSVYVGLTARSREVLQDGEFRVWRVGAVNAHWDGTWTLLGFSLPDSWQRQRHVLRSRLLWAGFGALQGGLWIAPSPVDVPALLDGLEAAEHVRVFQARALPPTDAGRLVGDAWDLAAIARRYDRFLDRWDAPRPPAGPPDSLARQLLLQTEWLQVIRQDPRLPREHLPGDWPAERAQRVFRSVHARLDPEARAIAADTLDTIPDEDADEPEPRLETVP